MRKKIVAGNWKMNLASNQAKALIKSIVQYTEDHAPRCKVIIAPSFVNLPMAKKETKDTKIKIAAQNMHQEEAGAYTGEISAEMLRGIKIRWVILGHSERRLYFGETDELLAKKVKKAISKGLQVIFCNGETLEERKEGRYFEVVKRQTIAALSGLNAEEMQRVTIAYEPVWAIGTGETASPEQAQEMHAHIRLILSEIFDEKIADQTHILYGGSVKPDNAKDIFSKPDVDGGLIGGAALKAQDFIEIMKACDEISVSV